MNQEDLVAIVFPRMTSLQSYVCGEWTAGSGDPVTLHNPSTAEAIGDVRPGGIDFAATLEHGRKIGGTALRAQSYQQRGEILKGLSKVIHELPRGPQHHPARPLRQASSYANTAWTQHGRRS